MKKKDFLLEVRELSVGDLHSRARAIGEELMKLRFRNSTGQNEQGHRFEILKKDLARVKTIITQKSAASSSSESKGAK